MRKLRALILLMLPVTFLSSCVGKSWLKASCVPCRKYDQNHYRPDFNKVNGSIRRMNTKFPAGISMLLRLPCREK